MSDAAPSHRSRTSAPAPRVAHAILANGARRPKLQEIAVAAGVSGRTVSNVLRRYGDAGVLRRDPLSFGPSCGLVLSFSVGTTSLRCGLVDANGRVLCAAGAASEEGLRRLAPDDVFDRVVALAMQVLDNGLGREALTRHHGGALPLLGVASTWPAPIDRAGHLAWGRGLLHPGWHDPDTGGPDLPGRVARAFAGLFPVNRCHVFNDANADTFAVAFSKTRERAGEPDDDHKLERLLLVLRVGGGIGAGTMVVAPHKRSRLSFVDSRIVTGTHGYAGELGHLPVSRADVHDVHRAPQFGLAPIDFDAWPCSCGQTGHLEALASAVACDRRLLASIPAGHNPSVVDAWRRGLREEKPAEVGDPVGSRAQRDCGRLLGRALASSILMFDPHRLTVTGSMARPEVLEGIRDERWVWGTIGDRVTIDALRDDYSRVRGAALAVFRRYVYRRMPEVLDGGEWRTLAVPFGCEHLEALHRR